MRKPDRAALSRSSNSRGFQRSCLVALAALAIGCGSTEAPRGVTGLWGGRTNYISPTDSFTLSLEQSGSEVKGTAFVRKSDDPSLVYDKFAVRGTLSGGQLNLTFSTLNMPMGVTTSLSGVAMGDGIDLFWDYPGRAAISIPLRRIRPNASGLAGTWALTSSVTAGLADTIIVSADGRAYRNRVQLFAMPAAWSRRGDWLVFDYPSPNFGSLRAPDLEDSLQIRSSELLRQGYDMTMSEHFTRISASTEMPTELPAWAQQ